MKKPHFFFIFHLLTDKKEQKYLKQKRKYINDNTPLAHFIDEFFSIKTKQALIEFLKNQKYIDLCLEDVDEEPINNLKEKVAYEINEYLLKLNN